MKYSIMDDQLLYQIMDEKIFKNNFFSTPEELLTFVRKKAEEKALDDMKGTEERFRRIKR
ncbi:MAG: hypothetical protein JRI80_18105 [Deltaproteobacteria bacterium]|nr:hypothetical protein [Deltaproteobacteria bacterium]